MVKLGTVLVACLVYIHYVMTMNMVHYYVSIQILGIDPLSIVLVNNTQLRLRG